MAQNYVLAEYNGTTRKVTIQGDWNKSFPFLIKDIKQKFNLSSADDFIDLRVFDKKNDRFFIIDKSEMREVRRGGLVQVTVRGAKGAAKGRDRSKNTKNANVDPRGRNQNQNGKTKNSNSNKGGKALLVPPGAPPYSKADDAKRTAWKVGSRVEIYSEGQKRWQKGEIVKIFKDKEGEWLVIKYAGFRTKEIQRFSNYIRPVESASTAKKNTIASSSSSKKKAVATKFKKKEEAGKKPKSASAKKADASSSSARAKNAPTRRQVVKKPSTQDKYVRQRKARLQFAENEVYIAGNTKHIKSSIDRAYLLLCGDDRTPMAEEMPTAQSGGDDEAGVDDDRKEVPARSQSEEDEEDEEDEVLITARDLTKRPSKIYGVIQLIGRGRSMSAVVSTAEFVKRIIPGLFQNTVLETVEIKDIWTPTEQGLKEVEIVRYQTRLKITLAKKEVAAATLDQSAAGYQDPVTDQEFVSQIDYSLHKARKGTRGARGQRGGRTGGGNGGATKK